MAAAAPRKRRRKKQDVKPDRPGWLEYRIDADGRLTDASRNWPCSAPAIGLPAVPAEQVVGELLWDLLADEVRARVYRQLIDRVQASGKPLRVPLRGDSATLRRELELTVTPLDDGGTAFRVSLQRVVPRPANPLLDPEGKRSELSLTMCGWCKRLQMPNGEWLELEEATIRLRTLGEKDMPQLVSDFCPACRQQFE